jgi:hypothetical protein
MHEVGVGIVLGIPCGDELPISEPEVTDEQLELLCCSIGLFSSEYRSLF